MKQITGRIQSVELIALEAPIGAGKTTLAQNIIQTIEKNKKTKVFPRSMAAIAFTENIPQQELELFYKDTKKYGLRIQLASQELRGNQFETVKDLLTKLQYYETAENEDDVQELWVIMDRTFLGDIIFASINHDLGNISDEGMVEWRRNAVVPRYSDMHKGIAKLRELKEALGSDKIKFKAHITFLKDDIKHCYMRIMESRKNKAEASISMHYLQILEAEHIKCFHHLRESVKNFFDEREDAQPVERKEPFVFLHVCKPGIYMNIPAFMGTIHSNSQLEVLIKSSDIYANKSSVEKNGFNQLCQMIASY